LIGKIALLTIKWITTVFKKVIRGYYKNAKKLLDKNEYIPYYLQFGLLYIFAILIDLGYFKAPSIIYFLVSTHYLCAVVYSIYYFINSATIKGRMEVSRFVKNFSVALFYFNMFSMVFINNIFSINSLIIDIILYANLGIMFLCFYGYWVIKSADSVRRLLVIMISAPIISYLCFDFVRLIGVNSKLLSIRIINDTAIMVIVIILSLLFINSIVYLVPIKNIKEVRVSIQLMIATFTTLSYLMYLLGDMSNYIINKLVAYELGVTEEDIKNILTSILNGITLPYLVSCVWSLFFIELRERNLECIKGP